jgi:adenine-specific DNA methylase
LNVFSGANGDWLKQTEWVKRFLEKHSWKSIASASVFQASATKISFPDEFFDAIFTDPPYYDNVPYSDLSDFFYVWFKRVLGSKFSELFATPLTPKREEIVANKGRQQNPKEFFEQNISLAFKEMNRVLKQSGIAIIVYAHKSTSGWATMLNALVQAGFVITASWPIHTEMKTRLRARTSAALASSIYLVCRKYPQEEIGYFNEIRDELDSNIQERLQRFWEEGIRGGDFFISAIGPAMETLSKYKQIKRYSGENVSFQDQLDYIRAVSTNYLVNILLKGEAKYSIDNLSQFYLAYRWTFQDNVVEYGEVQKLSQACGIEFQTLKKIGLVDQKGSKINLFNALERPKTKINDLSFVNIMHGLLIAWKEGNSDELDTISSLFDKVSNTAFWKYCQAVAECHSIKNPEKQLLEGILTSKYSR